MKRDSRRLPRLYKRGWAAVALAAELSWPLVRQNGAAASPTPPAPTAGSASPQESAASSPSARSAEEEARKILEQRLEVDKRGVAISIGMIGPAGRWELSRGPLSLRSDAGLVNSGTLFEIGSVTKVFTTVLLADMVQRGEVELDDPVAKYLPPGAKLPVQNGREITLLDLATHRSGLPSVPSNLKSADDKNPWADYSEAQLYQFLAGFQPTTEIGTAFAYSNLGAGLLGRALSRRAGKNYEDLIRERVCFPLGMEDTYIKVPPEKRAWLAVPYDKSLTETKPWDLPTIEGAGALRSNVGDLVQFIKAQLEPGGTPLAKAIRDTQAVRGHTDSPNLDIALGWHVLTRFDAPIYWQNGGTGGFRSFVGFCPARQTGVVILSNSAFGVDDIGFHLLDDRFELHAPARDHATIKITPEIADRYVGQYDVMPQFGLTFSREGDRYFVQPTGSDKDEVFPESETDFFSKSFDGGVSFVRDGKGQYSSMIVHQAGLPDQTARRTPQASASPAPAVSP